MQRGQVLRSAFCAFLVLLCLGRDDSRPYGSLEAHHESRRPEMAEAQAPQSTDGSPQLRVPIGSTLLAPTVHPPIPADSARLWLAPAGVGRQSARAGAVGNLTSAVRLHAQANYADALSLLSAPALAGSPLASYASYYLALAQFRVSRLDEARAGFAALSAAQPAGYLSEAAPLREAEVAEAQGDHADAVKIYERLSRRKTPAPDDVLMRLAGAAQAAGDRKRAAEAYARVYFEFPLSDLAAMAETELDRLPEFEPIARGNDRYTFELGRAERVFGARRYAQAREAFQTLQPHASGDDRELVALRLAECDFYLRRYLAAREGTRPYLERASRQAEAQFFFLTATRELRDHDEYLRLARQLVSTFPDSSWAEDTLNNLATHYILANEDDQADAVFRQLYERFPLSRYAERAAWKIGWWAYKNGQPTATIRVFEGAAAAFPRSDYRPAYVYWAGRSHDRVNNVQDANARYGLVAADYLNSYYGRLASKILEERGERPDSRQPGPVKEVGEVNKAVEEAPHPQAAEPALPPTADLIRRLLAAELEDEAMNELVYAQWAWGDSPAIQATVGWIHNRRGDLRRGINAVKRAYPQYLAAAGEKLPPEILKVVFPLEYWTLIRRHSAARKLDAYLIAALVAQESTFDPQARSSANAIGLMQLVSSTGRRYARTLGIRRFSASMLTNPETNVRLGTAYFSDLVRRFGGAHFALASYNAGEHRIARWILERPGLDRDEFVDDIPFPETQNYVKRILGTAEDYRRLYGSEASSLGDGVVAARPAATVGRVESSRTKRAPAKRPQKKRGGRKG